MLFLDLIFPNKQVRKLGEQISREDNRKMGRKNKLQKNEGNVENVADVKFIIFNKVAFYNTPSYSTKCYKSCCLLQYQYA